MGQFDETLPEAKQAGVHALITREQVRAQAAFLVAKKFPRDEFAAFNRAVKSFDRPGMAEDAQYAFPRGGKTIKGPSVDLAKEVARVWGNIECGHRIVAIEGDMVEVEGYCIDLETNSRRAFTDKFKRLIQRRNKQTDQTEWVEPDERDFRELCNRRGAIVMRNAILAVLPSDVIEECIRKSEETCSKAAKGELKQSRTDAVRRLVQAFDRIGISTQMLEAKLGHPVADIDDSELVELRAVWKSISDGNTKRSDHFNLGGGDQGETASKKELRERLERSGSVPAQKAVVAKEPPAKPANPVTSPAVPASAGSPEPTDPEPAAEEEQLELPIAKQPSPEPEKVAEPAAAAVVKPKKRSLQDEWERIQARAKKEEAAYASKENGNGEEK